jgi:hypothetical protein
MFNLRSSLYGFAAAILIVIVAFLVIRTSGCGRAVFITAEQDSVAANNLRNAFLRGKSEGFTTGYKQADSLAALREPEITYLTKIYHEPIPQKFTVAQKDTPYYFVMQFAGENMK